MEGEKSSKLFSLEEVKEHNTNNQGEKSVWLVIHDKVYDVSKFLDEVIKCTMYTLDSIYLNSLIHET